MHLFIVHPIAEKTNPTTEIEIRTTRVYLIKIASAPPTLDTMTATRAIQPIIIIIRKRLQNKIYRSSNSDIYLLTAFQKKKIYSIYGDERIFNSTCII
jgi:hypothetical protein